MEDNYENEPPKDIMNAIWNSCFDYKNFDSTINGKSVRDRIYETWQSVHEILLKNPDIFIKMTKSDLQKKGIIKPTTLCKHLDSLGYAGKYVHDMFGSYPGPMHYVYMKVKNDQYMFWIFPKITKRNTDNSIKKFTAYTDLDYNIIELKNDFESGNLSAQLNLLKNKS